MEKFQYPRGFLWLALGAAFALCLQYPLMYMYRQVYRSNYPEIFQSWAHNGSFAVIGTFAMETADEATYAARVQEVARHWLPRDPYLQGNRSLRILSSDFLTYLCMGTVQRIIKNIQWTWILLRWVSILAWMYLVYAIAWKLTQNAEWALFTAGFTVFFSYLLTLQFLSKIHELSMFRWKSILEMAWIVGSYGRTESVLRLPRPGLTYAALFFASLQIVAASERRTWSRIVASGLAGGLLAYVRTDIWSTYMAAVGIFATVISWKERKICRTLVASFGLSLAISLPWIWANLPPRPDILERLNPTYGRTPDLRSLGYLAGFAACLWWRNPMLLWVGSVSASVFIILNLQIITGYNIPDIFHWQYLGNVFLFFGGIFMAARQAVPSKFSWIKGKRLGLACFVLMGLSGLFQSITYSAIHYPFQGLPMAMEEAFAWLKTNSPTDSAVAALNTETSKLASVYSHNKSLVVHSSPVISDVFLPENAERLAYMLKLLGTDMDDFLRRTANPPPPDRRSLDRASMEMEYWAAAYFLYYPRRNLSKFLHDAEARLNKENKTFHIDYIWIGPFERLFAGPGFPSTCPLRLKPAFSNSLITIYQTT